MDREKFERILIAEARSWVGVSFLHNGRTKSQGVDCLGLIVCVFRGIGLGLPDGDGRHYAPDWFIHTPEERYFFGLLEHGVPVAREALEVGDIPYFRPGVLGGSGIERITHGGIYLGGGEMVHSLSGRAVEITKLEYRAWKKSWAGAIRLKAVLTLLGEKWPEVPDMSG